MIESQFKTFKTFDKVIFPNAIDNFTLMKVLLDEEVIISKSREGVGKLKIRTPKGQNVKNLSKHQNDEIIKTDQNVERDLPTYGVWPS
jgi:hypothetical protein